MIRLSTDLGQLKLSPFQGEINANISVIGLEQSQALAKFLVSFICNACHQDRFLLFTQSDGFADGLMFKPVSKANLAHAGSWEDGDRENLSGQASSLPPYSYFPMKKGLIKKLPLDQYFSTVLREMTFVKDRKMNGERLTILIDRPSLFEEETRNALLDFAMKASRISRRYGVSLVFIDAPPEGMHELYSHTVSNCSSHLFIAKKHEEINDSDFLKPYLNRQFDKFKGAIDGVAANCWFQGGLKSGPLSLPAKSVGF